MSKYTSKQINRFWSKVNKNGSIPAHYPELGNCWEWTAGKQKFGYGVFGYEHANSIGSHRFSWYLAFGEIPDNLHVLHKCDNPSCVNPNHLFLGTQSDNIKDMDKKGRRITKRYEKHGRAKLTNNQVKEIRELYANSNETYRSIGRKYGVSRTTIYFIINNMLWRIE